MGASEAYILCLFAPERAGKEKNEYQEHNNNNVLLKWVKSVLRAPQPRSQRMNRDLREKKHKNQGVAFFDLVWPKTDKIDDPEKSPA